MSKHKAAQYQYSRRASTVAWQEACRGHRRHGIGIIENISAETRKYRRAAAVSLS